MNVPYGRSSLGIAVSITIAAAMTSGCPVALSDEFVIAGDGGEQLAAGGSNDECPAAAPPNGDQCPEEVCTGGCVGGECLITCTAEKKCDGFHVTCPPGFACHVDCIGNQSCHDLALTCPSADACDIVCSGTEACTGATFSCKDGPCSIGCNSPDACKDATVSCSTGACRASCATGSVQPPRQNNCDNACTCQHC